MPQHSLCSGCADGTGTYPGGHWKIQCWRLQTSPCLHTQSPPSPLEASVRTAPAPSKACMLVCAYCWWSTLYWVLTPTLPGRSSGRRPGSRGPGRTCHWVAHTGPLASPSLCKPGTPTWWTHITNHANNAGECAATPACEVQVFVTLTLPQSRVWTGQPWPCQSTPQPRPCSCRTG